MPDTPEAPARYDSLATGYAQHWGPVIRPATEAVLDRVVAAPAPGSRILDVGTGTGTLALLALERWPGTTVAAVDASEAMLALLADAARGRLREGDFDRLDRVVAVADRLPFEDATFDVAISSFVLQLVPSRAAALREMRRVLRPGGRLAWVTWLVGGARFRADEIVEEVLDELGFDPPDRDGRAGDLASVAAAAAGTRRAGFRDVQAEAGELVHRWPPDAYAEFITEFDEQSTFESLDAAERTRADRRLRSRLGDLSREELTMRLPVVYVTGVAR